MKTFEEKFTAWVDGLLTGEELRQFELELATVENAGAEKTAALKLGDLLRREYAAPTLSNADFFNHQILQRISAETPRSEEAEPRAAVSLFSLWKLALGGALSVAVAVALFIFVVRPAPTSNPTEQNFLAKLSETRTGDPDVIATSFQSKDNHVTVLWLDGLEYIPELTAQK